MPRPRTINPEGRTRTFGVMVAEPMYDRLRREATRRGITLGALVREKLEAAS